MIGIGITEDVVLMKTSINDKGTLELHFVEKKMLGTTKLSIFEEANSAKVSADDRATMLLLFPFKKPSGPRNDGKTDDELLEMISADMKQTKNRLQQLLEQFLPEGEIKWDAYMGTGVTAENHRSLLLQTPILETIAANYFGQFITMATPFLGKPERAVRIKLVRQSTDKNFATIPGRYLDEMPWVESMDVPKDRSRVKFSQWELDNGFDSAAAVKKSDTDEKPPVENTPEAKKSAFGVR